MASDRKPIPSWGRLSCFLAWAFCAPALAADPTPDAWTVQTSTDAEPQSFVVRLDHDGQGVLLVECDAHTVLVDLGEAFRVDGWGESPPLKVQFDDGDVERIEVRTHGDLPPTMAFVTESFFGLTLMFRESSVLYVWPPSDPRGAPHAFTLDGLGETVDGCDPTPTDREVVVLSYIPMVVDGESYSPFHPSELAVRKQVLARYPEGGTLGRVRCVVRVYIDEKGRPTRVDTGDCPEPYSGAAVDCLMQWRWQGARVNGKRLKATFRVPVNFDP